MAGKVITAKQLLLVDSFMRPLLILLIGLATAIPAQARPTSVLAERIRCQSALVDQAAKQNRWMDGRSAQTRCACIANARVQNLSTHACPEWDTTGQWLREKLD